MGNVLKRKQDTSFGCWSIEGQRVVGCGLLLLFVSPSHKQFQLKLRSVWTLPVRD